MLSSMHQPDESGNKMQQDAARDTVKRFSPVARIPVPQIRIFPGTFLSVAPRKKSEKDSWSRTRKRWRRRRWKASEPRAKEEERRRTNEGRITGERNIHPGSLHVEVSEAISRLEMNEN